MRPLIGITCKLIAENGDAYYKLDRNYADSVRRAGGEPLPLPLVRDRREASTWLDRLGGILFSGGADINPVRWGEKKHPKASLLHPDKETSDFLYMQEALRRDRPVFAICLGSQILNVALGGSLHQHIGEDHRDARHPVDLAPSRTREILGKARPVVNSYHHQAIHTVARGLQATAHAPDGTIEGVESASHRFVVAVQWHPERMADRPEQRALFRAFAAECRR